MERTKRIASKSVGLFGLACVLYAVYSLVIGEMYFPSKPGKIYLVEGWTLTYRASGLIIAGSYAATYIFHNGYNYTNRTIYKASKFLMVATGLYAVVVLVVVTTVLVNKIN